VEERRFGAALSDQKATGLQPDEIFADTTPSPRKPQNTLVISNRAEAR
jgi:hypothetical protein